MNFFTSLPGKYMDMDAGTIVAGLPMPRFRHIEVTPLTGACGAEIRGVDLRERLSDDLWDEIELAFRHFLVIMLRDQPLSPEQHKQFSRRFGKLIDLPQAPTYGEHQDMQEVRREAHEPVSVVPFTRMHTDSPFLKRPPKCMIMRALEVPRHGGDTAFANMYLAYEELSDGLKAMLEQARVVYSGKDIWAKNQSLDPDKRLRLRESHDFSLDELENSHPAVRHHPVTGRPALYVTSAYFKRFEGWTDADSKGLLDYLNALPYRLQYQCRIKWEPDTLIVWDNRFLQHCGIHDYHDERRHLVRTTIEGETPA
jgi:taurine dioxygenase